MEEKLENSFIHCVEEFFLKKNEGKKIFEIKFFYD